MSDINRDAFSRSYTPGDAETRVHYAVLELVLTRVFYRFGLVAVQDWTPSRLRGIAQRYIYGIKGKYVLNYIVFIISPCCEHRHTFIKYFKYFLKYFLSHSHLYDEV